MGRAAVGALERGTSKVSVARRLALAWGRCCRRRWVGRWGRWLREVRLTGALAKVGLEVGMPPKRAVWSMMFCAVTWSGEAVADGG